ncbi:MAG: hypothetical protein U0892_05315 [Pirellulales bacterium]
MDMKKMQEVMKDNNPVSRPTIAAAETPLFFGRVLGGPPKALIGIIAMQFRHWTKSFRGVSGKTGIKKSLNQRRS